MTDVIGLLNIMGTGAIAGTGVRGSLVGTGCAGNTGLCCRAVLELRVDATCNTLKICVLARSDCRKCVSYANRPVGLLGRKDGS